jgi:hypothetical protein
MLKVKTRLSARFIIPGYEFAKLKDTSNPLLNFLYQADAIKKCINYFQQYCAQHDLDSYGIRKLFFICDDEPRHYVDLNAEKLKHRLVLEGVLQVLGEVTATLYKCDTPQESLIKFLNVNAKDFEILEQFIVTVTNFRHNSVHALRYTDISVTSETLLNVAGMAMFTQQLDTLVDIAKQQYPETQENIDNIPRCGIM